jgi:tetratricopeptide (TPR) repeat protein
MSGSTPTVKRAIRAGAGVIVLALVVIYHGIFSVPFLFDDYNAVSLNPTIRHLWPPWEALRTPQGTGAETDGRPLANLSLAFNYRLSGTQPGSYHAVTLLLHALAALVLFGVVRRTLAIARVPYPVFSGFAVALLWAVHPLQTETVTTVAHRTELLVTLFYLLTLYGFIRSQKSPKGVAPARGWAAVAVTACYAGMLSKEVMVSAPLIVFLYDRTFVSGTFAAAWTRHRRLHLALGSSWLVLAGLRVLSPQRGGTGGFGLGITPWHYALTQCGAIIHYLRLSFWPRPLVLDYGDQVVAQVSDVLPQGLLLLALLAATGVALWKKPMLGFAGACFFAILAPSSSFLPLVTQTVAEHRMYLPLAAVLTLALCGLQRLWLAAGKPVPFRPFATLLLAAAIGLGWATVERNRDFRSAIAIWTTTADQVPRNPRPHDNLANALLEAGAVPAAIAQYEIALGLDPADVQAHYNLGGVDLQAGRLSEAIAHYEAALRVAPGFSRAHDNLGTALLRSGRRAEAIIQFAAAVRTEPDNAGAHYNLANALAQAGRVETAIPEYESALRLAPEMADAHFNLAMALTQAGRPADARREYQAVLRLTPNDAEARANLARLQVP